LFEDLHGLEFCIGRESFELSVQVVPAYSLSRRFGRLAATLAHRKELGITTFPGIARKRENLSPTEGYAQKYARIYPAAIRRFQ
jgi:hypothetical protein